VSGVTAKSIVYISSSFLHEMGKRNVVVGFPFSPRFKHMLQKHKLTPNGLFGCFSSGPFHCEKG